MERDSVVRASLAGKDPDSARAMYEDNYNGDTFDVELTEAEFSYRYTSVGNADMTLRSSTFLGSIRGSIQPQNEYIVSWISDGRGVVDLGHDESALELGLPAMFPTGKRFSFDFQDYRQSLIHFRGDFLEEIAAEHEGALIGPVRFDHTAVPDRAALAGWKAAVDESAGLLLRGEPTPLQLSQSARRTAIALLDTFAHQVELLPPALLIPGAGHARAAVEYIHTHAHLTLTPTLIAEHLGISTRTLQHAFTTHLETTPMSYLRGVRLDRVRAELLHLHERETTVSVVAARWGFTHAGRFSAAYAARFHEYPRVTLTS